MKCKWAIGALAVLAGSVWAGVLPEWTVSFDPSAEIGRIKPMNAVNNGPLKLRSDQSLSNFNEYKALRIPYARLHDSAICWSYGGPHAVDISGVFPDFGADENDPADYDFTLTDEYLETIRKTGTEPYYRLGQSIEHWIRKYGVNPPKDFAKWARICEHVVRHYNEGWANGFRWNIRYWEIWNEPDGNRKTPDGRLGPTWTGTTEQFLELYKVTSLHLRKCFGETIRIGGPGMCGWSSWKDDFIPFCAKENLPLDFYSYHCYFSDPKAISRAADGARRLLDDNGFTKAETHLNEWNYVFEWGEGWIYSLECESGRYNQKGAAAIAAAMCVGQDSPVDMLMYYDARVGTSMNGLFERATLLPMRGYYPFLAWSRLVELGTQVRVSVATPEPHGANLYAVAAKGADGRLALFMSRFHDDNNAVWPRRVRVSLPPGGVAAKVRCHLTDPARIHTETPVVDNGDGTVSLCLHPQSFALLEFDR